tara:strand:+ start:8129 stop:9364 length:1236 start_codon:yes stop_codon:yes gene_type:complete
MKKKILVKAPMLSQSGYGEQSRFALRALRSREDLFEIYALPITWGQTGWIWQENEFREWLDERITQTQIEIQQKTLSIDVSLQITIPNEFERIAPMNIGYTAGIETHRCSPQWLPKCNEMDKVLVVSNHAKVSLVDTTATAVNNETGEETPYTVQKPVEVVWETTPRRAPEPIDGFELEYNNNFLVVSQMGPRKNFTNTISWFVEEFIDRKVGLIVKTNLKNNSMTDASVTEGQLKEILSKYPDRKCKVYLLHGDLKSSQMTWLYQHPKIASLINISHGEGFGLPMFEAAREGLPVIAVGWSGHLDFLIHDGKEYFENVKFTMQSIQQEVIWDGVLEKDSMWAYAEQGSYKMTLRRTLKKINNIKKRSQELKSILEKKFSDEKLYKGFVDEILGFDSSSITQEEEEVLEFE